MSAIQLTASRSWPLLARRVRPGVRSVLAPAAGAAGVAFAAAMIAVSRGYDHGSLAAYDRSVADFVAAAAPGLAFLAAGLAAWWRRPENRVGWLMVAAGTAWYASSLQFTSSPPLDALGYWLAYLAPVIVSHLSLAYPDGTLRRRSERWAVGASYAVYLTLQGLRYAVEGWCNHAGVPGRVGTNCGGALLPGLVSLDALAFDALFTFWLLRRWWAASRPTRRLHAPVWLGFSLLSALLVANVFGSLLRLASGVQLALLLGYGLCLVGLPFAFLSGLLRARLARHRVTDLVVRLDGAAGPARLRELLADALCDPGLVLGLWSDAAAAYVDAAGRPLPAADTGPGPGVTFVERSGRPLAVLVHDPSLDEQRALVEATVAAARLALDNARLAEAALHERRRIERDLHDGLQHRLLRLSWMADRTGVAELAHDARDAYVRLRELARGIHPAILTERGLAAAVEEHVLQVGVPVLVDLPGARCPAAVEAAAFFTVAEALTNAVKHAAAGRVTVRGRLEDGRLTVEVADDGGGGADPARGTGLGGLQERAAALGGRLTVHSAPGLGTAVVLELPCG
jgi:signal transduction histidine kinase